MIVNRHVSAHIEGGEMTMLYRVEDGPSDQSFGINVAEVRRAAGGVSRGAGSLVTIVH